MKIVIDATPLAIPFPCGTKNYAAELLKALAKNDSKNEYCIIAPQKIQLPAKSNFHLRVIPKIRLLKRQLLMPFVALKEKPDVFHYFEPYGSIFFRHKAIVTTVHDVDLSSTYPFGGRFLLNRIYCEVARYFVFRHTSFFITPSKSIKTELSAFSPVGRRKVCVIKEGVNDGYADKGFKRSNFLCMGDFAPRKNLKRIVEAYAGLPKSVLKRNKLLIAVTDKLTATRMSDLVSAKNLKKNVAIMTNVSDKKLKVLYAKSLVFVYPSLYEGFGLPVVEAMASGCPVITSNKGALKETAGKSAFLVNPNSTADIKKAMYEVCTNTKLRMRLKIKGLKMAKKYTWDKTAKETISLYEKASG